MRKLLSNPGIVVGGFLVGVAMTCVFWLAFEHKHHGKDGKVTIVHPVKTSVSQQVDQAISDAHKLVAISEFTAAQQLLQKESERLTGVLVAEPALQAMIVNGLLQLEAAKIGEKIVTSSNLTDRPPSDDIKRQVAVMYIEIANGISTAKGLARQFKLQGVEISNLEASLSECDRIHNEALEGLKRLSLVGGTTETSEELDLIPFPFFGDK